MKKPSAPAYITPWIATVAKWSSIAVAALGTVYGLSHGLPNIISMFEYAPPQSGVVATGMGLATHLALPLVGLVGGLVGYNVASKTEKLTEQVQSEKKAQARDKKMGVAVPQVSVMMEREGKPGKSSATLAFLLGGATAVGGTLAIAQWVIGGMGLATLALPVTGALLIAGGSALAATGLFAGDATDYANSRDTEKERRQILAKAQIYEIDRMQKKVGDLSDRLDAAMVEAKFSNRQHRDSWASKIRAEELRKARQYLERADMAVAGR